jgi:EAL domain-containing protein (putative c-di-GMP-specific phosphodiesterase class I)
MVQGLPVSIKAAVGVAIYPQHGEDCVALMRNADIAMYGAKQTNSGAKTYSHERDRRSHGRIGLAAGLLGAIHEGELFLHYQPKVEMRTRHIVGVESLVRWRHPRLGILAPSEFVPVAEHTELIEQLTNFVLAESLEQCKRWKASGFEVPVAVNVSARNLHDLRFPARVAALLDEVGIHPDDLEIELTENTVMEDLERTVSVTRQLRSMGIRVSVDDFGTGYSSLATLRDLPVNAIKIDRSFVAPMATDRGNAAIVEATIGLAHRLGLETIAEGVEQVADWQILEEFGCDIAQGYLVGPPVDGNGIVEFILESSVSRGGVWFEAAEAV